MPDDWTVVASVAAILKRTVIQRQNPMSPFNRSWRQFSAIGIFALLAACAEEAPPAHVAANPPPQSPGHDAIWFQVRFASGSDAIDADGQKVIDSLLVTLRANPKEGATIIGKTDSVGGQDYNMHLSHKRADAVRDALVYAGKIPANHVETRWIGEKRQEVATADDVSMAANRVVEIAVH